MTETRTIKFQWLFWIIAFLLAVFAFDMVWWQALIIIVVASIEFTITTTYRSTYKYPRPSRY